VTHNQKRRDPKKGEQGTTDGEREREKVKEEEDPPATFCVTWKDHPSLAIGKRTHVDFRARVQADTRSSDTAFADSDGSSPDVARRRIAVEGDIEHLVEFQVERELGDDEPWRDVYANYHQFDVVQVQAGKFKLPFSLDENTSPTNLDFV
jgi:phosphate-selective porin